MKTFYFYLNNVIIDSEKLVIIKAVNEERAKELLINTYFKGLSGLLYEEIIDMLEEKEFYITLVKDTSIIEDKECSD